MIDGTAAISRPDDALGAVAADVARDLAAAGGMADQGRVSQIGRLEHCGEVVGVAVHVVVLGRLAGAASSSTSASGYSTLPA
jgi:hypothetical protein